MSSKKIQILITQVDSEASPTGWVKRIYTLTPQIYMMVDAVNIDGSSHPVKRREANIIDAELISVSLLVY